MNTPPSSSLLVTELGVTAPSTIGRPRSSTGGSPAKKSSSSSSSMTPDKRSSTLKGSSWSLDAT